MSNIEEILLNPDHHEALIGLLVDAGIDGAEVTLTANRTRVFYALKYEGGPEIHSFVHRKWLEGDHAVADGVLESFVVSVAQSMVPATESAGPTPAEKIVARDEGRVAVRVSREERLKARKDRRAEHDKAANERGAAAKETRVNRRETRAQRQTRKDLRDGPPESE